MTRQRFKTRPGHVLRCQGKVVTDAGEELTVTHEVNEHRRLGRLSLCTPAARDRVAGAAGASRGVSFGIVRH